jgi:hypothetical protein
MTAFWWYLGDSAGERPSSHEEGVSADHVTHAICDDCYDQRAPSRGWALYPSRVIYETNEVVVEACCFCGKPTAGIYVRMDPYEVHGRVAA